MMLSRSALPIFMLAPPGVCRVMTGFGRTACDKAGFRMIRGQAGGVEVA